MCFSHRVEVEQRRKLMLLFIIIRPLLEANSATSPPLELVGSLIHSEWTVQEIII